MKLVRSPGKSIISKPWSIPTLDSLQNRISQVETHQPGRPVTGSIRIFCHGPTTWSCSRCCCCSSSSDWYQVGAAVSVGPLKEVCLKSEMTAPVRQLIATLGDELCTLVQECLAPGFVREPGIIKLKPSGQNTKPHMWKLYNALKNMDMHAFFRFSLFYDTRS